MSPHRQVRRRRGGGGVRFTEWAEGLCMNNVASLEWEWKMSESMLIKVFLCLFGSPTGSFAFYQPKPWQEVHGGSRKKVTTTTTRRQTHVKLRQCARKPSPTSHVYFPHTFLFISETRLKGLLTDKTEKSSSSLMSRKHFHAKSLLWRKNGGIFAWMRMEDCASHTHAICKLDFHIFSIATWRSPDSFSWLFVIRTSNAPSSREKHFAGFG